MHDMRGSIPPDRAVCLEQFSELRQLLYSLLETAFLLAFSAIMGMGQPVRTSSATALWCPPSWLGFLWGFAEATLFFIIPDVVLSWASLAGAKCGIKIFGAILAGAIVGGFCMYLWAVWQPEVARSAVAGVPFVRTKMFDQVQADYRSHGVSGIFYTLGTGIPYKVYAVLAPPVCSPITFVPISFLARLERMVLSWLIPTILGGLLQRWIRNHQRLTGALWIGFWVITYARYWSTV
jgi:membrane protein YqaA with SNARE-associated domain